MIIWKASLKYTRLLSKGTMPATNICYLLFLDLVEWYSTDSTSNMRYRAETVKFWQIGYRLFHGKFLRFMSGPRHAGHVLSAQSEKGRYELLQFHVHADRINALQSNSYQVFN